MQIVVLLMNECTDCTNVIPGAYLTYPYCGEYMCYDCYMGVDTSRRGVCALCNTIRDDAGGVHERYK